MTDIAIGLAARAGAGLLKYLPYVIGAAALIGAGAYADRHAPLIGAQPTIDRLTHDRDAWRGVAGGYQTAYGAERGAFAQSEDLRRKETGQARAAVQAMADDAAAQVARARQSTQAINRIVNKEPTYDPHGCPVRELVPLGELRDAIRPTAAAPG